MSENNFFGRLPLPNGATLKKALGASLLLMCMAAPCEMYAQTQSNTVGVENVQALKGTVVDKNGEPLVGVTVIVKGTNIGTSTDLDGAYQLNARPNSTLEFSYIGYKSVTVKASSAGNIVMQDDAQNLDEVVVVGYSSTTRRDMIASVSTVKTREIANIPVTNIAQGLAGRSPGLIVKASGGGINSRPNISIRGGGTPIYVIDGVIRNEDDFANLSPDDIENMSILKDASATAVYGSRATNGIIQITTKSGSKGRVNVEYDLNYSLAQPSIWPKQMNSYDRAYWGNVARANDGLDPVYSDEAIKAMRDGSQPQTFGNTNWRELVLNDWAPQTKNTARIFGGNDITRFYVSLGHIYQNSMYKSNNHWMKRTNFRMSQSTALKEIGVTINATLDGYRQKQTHPFTSTSSGYYQVFSHINDKSPLLPGVNSFGLPYLLNDNPVAETAKDTGYNNNTYNVINGKGEVIWALPWVDGLKFRVASNYRYYSNTNKSWRKDPAQYSWDSTIPEYANKPLLSHRSMSGYAYTNQAFAEYSKEFGKHTIGLLGGFEQYYEKGEDYWMQRDKYDFNIDQINVGPADTKDNSGSEAELGRAAWIVQGKYYYDHKYYAEASMRYDGSDRFAPGQRWGAFFGGSLAWVVTEESFMKSLVEKNILNNFKIRASYGETGLDESAGRFAYLTSYNLNTQGYVVDGKYVPGFTEGSLPSPDLTWYTTRQTDIGFDFSTMNNQIWGQFDYFYYSTKGYLISPTGQSYLNQVIGIGMPRVKSDSEHRRAGVEIQLGYRGNVADFTYSIAANCTYYDELWAKKEDEAESSYMNPYTRQQQQKSFYGTLYTSEGFYKSADDVYNSPGFTGALNSGYLTAGDLKYADVNGDGIIDSNDSRRKGKSRTPRTQFGIDINLGYKGFYFSTLLQGSSSFNLYLPGSLAMKTGQAGAMPVSFDFQTDVWSPTNADAKFPRLMSNTGLNGNNNYVESDFWLVNGSYLRMKDIQFGYDLKYKVLKNVKWLAKAKVGFSGQNLFTISPVTKYGMDPETSNTENYGYPVERIIAFTLNLGF